MLKTRVMPVVLLTGYNVVKGIQFGTYRTLGNPITVSKVYDGRLVDELILLDIRASQEKRGPRLDIISDIASECFMPLTIGGGIKSLDQAREVIRRGADKVAINSGALERPGLIKEISNEFGAQCVVVSIDVKENDQGEKFVFSNSGKSFTRWKADDWAEEVQNMGAGEILLNSVDRDGKMTGYDLSIIQEVKKRISIPLIVCGGAGEPKDCYEAIQIGGADAVAAASMFHFTSITPRIVKEYLQEHGIPTRL